MQNTCFGVNCWRQETFNFDLYYSSDKKVGEVPTKLGGQSKLENFVPESIVPNIVECFFDIQESRYYMFALIEVFRDGLEETEKWSFVDLDFLKPDWYLLKKPLSSRCFQRHFSMTRSKSFIIALSKLMGQ